MNFRCVLTIVSLCLLVACGSTGTTRPVEASLDSAIADNTPSPQARKPLQKVPDDVAQALMPALPAKKDNALFGERRMNIQAEQVEAAAFFAGLVEGTPYSMAVHPEVQGRISLDLKQVTLEDVLELVTEIYGYDVQRRGNVYRIYPSGMRTETFAVNYLLMQRDGFTQTSITSGGISQQGGSGGNNSNQQSGANNNAFQGGGQQGGFGGQTGGNGTNISTRSQTDFWDDLRNTLQTLVGTEGGRSVIVSPQAGLVTIRAMSDEIRAVKKYLKTSEEHVQRQVVLEARIIEISLSDEYQQGINWTKVLANAGTTDFQFSSNGQIGGNTITGGLGGLTSLAFVGKDFSGVLNLLSTQGNLQVLSSPRVTATNNQKAVIKVGDDEYFVTDVSSQSTTTATSTSNTPNIQLTPFFSGIALDVTPQIDQDGGVLLHVHPSVIETSEQEKVITLNEEQYVLPLAQSNIRESDTVIRANSGEIVVIGGLMQSIKTESNSKTPLLGSIPLLGELFKNRREQETKKELVILIKPTVVGPDTWRQQLQQSRQYMSDWLGAN